MTSKGALIFGDASLVDPYPTPPSRPPSHRLEPPIQRKRAYPAKTPAVHLREQACQSKFISRAQTKEVSRMRRRIFVTSGLGLMAAAATQGLVGTFAGAGLRAQPAAAPMGPPQGKWIRLAPLPQATGELLGVAINGKVYAAQGLLTGFKPAGLVYEYDPAKDA